MSPMGPIEAARRELAMPGQQHRMTIATVLMLAGSVVSGQTSTLASSKASVFLGTWTINMTEPKGALETVRIWDNDGKVAATVQTERFPPVAVSDVAKMGRSLVLAATRFENGKPIQAIVILTLDGETMNMIQELEGSSLTKRGSGKQQ